MLLLSASWQPVIDAFFGGWMWIISIPALLFGLIACIAIIIDGIKEPIGDTGISGFPV